MKQILLAMLCALAVLTSCKPQHRVAETMTFKRVDLSGAKFITLASSEGAQAVGKASQETNRLYKIDENGNMTAVVFYIEVDREGNKTTENSTEDLRVIPGKIIDYGRYMRFYGCRIKCLTEKYSHLFNGYDNLDFLVRKSDGAIFEIDQANQAQFFPNDDYYSSYEELISKKQITYNVRGELYMIGDRNVSKLKVENDRLLLQQITTRISAYSIMVDKDDNLYVDISRGRYIYSANGSVATISYEYGHVLLIDNEYYIYKRTRKETGYDDYTATHQLLKITSYAPKLELKEIATLTTEDDGYYGVSVIEIDSKVIFSDKYSDSYMLYDKLTQKLSIRPLPDEFKAIDARYNEQGIAYQYAEDRTHIMKYNIVDVTTKRIDCDRSAVPPFIPREIQQTSTDFFEFGIQNSNGAPIRIQTTLETGKVTVREDADDRKITELIKVS